jgi:hypothetical protein
MVANGDESFGKDSTDFASIAIRVVTREQGCWK